MYAVFCQSPSPVADAAALTANAARLFHTTLRIAPGAGNLLNVTLERAKPPLVGQFCVATRATTPSDWQAAREAEARGRAAGMSTLAARCPVLWEIRAVGPEDSA